LSRKKVFIAGHEGLVGSSLYRLLKKKKIILITKKKNELNLINQEAVQKFFKKEKIDQVYIAAAKVGGIYVNNKYPGEFIYQNIMIQTNIIHSAFTYGVKKILFLGSSCIYPKNANQPIKEEELLSGKLEPTNEPYSIAKIAGIKMCESYNRQYGKSHGIDYRCVMPTNMYGPGDKYDEKVSHVIPALIKKFHEATIKKKKTISIWGTGNAKREFLHVDDFAIACFKIMNLSRKIFYKNLRPECSHVNVGSGNEVTIKQLALIIKKITGFEGMIEFDKSKPDGMKRKLVDLKHIHKLGWKSKIDLIDGLEQTYLEFKKKLISSN
jgi:GDP-L-fucose synthase